MSNFPSSEEEGVLVGMLFDAITDLQEEIPMADRSDMAMACFAAVKKWARKEELVTKPELPEQPVVVRIHTG